MELPSNETIKQAVIAGLGLSLMSLPSVELELKAGVIKVLDIAGTPIVRTWNVVHLSSRVLSPAAEAFRYFLLEQGDAYLRERSEGLRSALPAPVLKTAPSTSTGNSAARARRSRPARS